MYNFIRNNIIIFSELSISQRLPCSLAVWSFALDDNLVTPIPLGQTYLGGGVLAVAVLLGRLTWVGGGCWQQVSYWADLPGWGGAGSSCLTGQTYLGGGCW